MAKGALVRPPLSDVLQLVIPNLNRVQHSIYILNFSVSFHQFPHVCCSWLRPVGLLPFSHPPPELVVPVQQRLLGLSTQRSEYHLGGALVRRALEWSDGCW